MIGAPARIDAPSAEVLDLGCGDGTMAVPGYYLLACKFPVKGSVLGRPAVILFIAATLPSIRTS
jgi:hypothetical protein